MHRRLTLEILRHPLLAAIYFSFAVALFDAYMLHSVFEPTGYSQIEHYHYAMWGIFIPLVILLVGALWDFWFVPYSVVLNYMYFEDILFFLVQGQMAPQRLPWLKGDPHPVMIISQVVMGCFFIFLMQRKFKERGN